MILVVTAVAQPSQAADTPPGLDSRAPNPNCVAGARPETDAKVALEPAFPGLKLGGQGPMMMVQLPTAGGDWLVAEREGLIKRFADNQSVTTANVVLDLRDRFGAWGDGQIGIHSIAVHPNFASNGHLYVAYNSPGTPYRGVIERFTSSDGGASFGPTDRKLLDVPHKGIFHGVGNLVFGADGYLYISMGDGVDGTLGQDKNDLHASVMRVDVDRGNPYAIPADNPFAGGGGRPEIFAYGLRNPFRFSIDEQSNTIWAGDVGQNSWEEVNLIKPGANYGWRLMEGNECSKPGCDPTGLEPPALAYPHDGRCSVIGGHVYRGSSIPGLNGVYLYGDVCDGKIYGLTEDKAGQWISKEILSTGIAITTFAESRDEEIYVLSSTQNKIRRLVPASTGSSLKVAAAKKLSETGCFNPTNPRQTASGVIPYNINSALWSDGAGKRRWMALPDNERITIDADGDFDFPIGTVLIKEFSLAGSPIETRLLMHHTDGTWAGYSYEWNSDLSDATLVPNGKTKQIGDQTWLYPNPGQCLECHTPAANRALGPELAQFNRDMFYPSTGRNAQQLQTLAHIGIFNGALPALSEAATMVDIGNTTATLDQRARSYLHANCAGCHRPNGPAQVAMDLRYQIPTHEAKICNVAPAISDLGIAGASLLAPGDPGRSIISRRIHTLDGNRMPPLATSIVDTAGVAVVDAWINSASVCVAPASTPIVASVLPTSRSVTMGNTATVFATIINAGATPASGCSISPAAGFSGDFSYQGTDSATNVPVGSPNTPVTIAPGAAQSFVLALKSAGIMAPTDVKFTFACAATPPAVSMEGINTLLLSVSDVPVPDIVTLAATSRNDGTLHLDSASGQGAFAVANINLGAEETLTVTARSSVVQPLIALSICQTNPGTGQCLGPAAASVSTRIGNGSTPTFAVFAKASAPVPIDAAKHRIFVEFKDPSGSIRGSGSVAVSTD